MIKHENQTIDNTANISENSNDFLRSFVKSLKKVSTSHEKVHEYAIIQNEKLQRAEKLYLQPAIMRIFPVVSIQKQSPASLL